MSLSDLSIRGVQQFYYLSAMPVEDYPEANFLVRRRISLRASSCLPFSTGSNMIFRHWNNRQ